ncbi:MAG: alanine dehydrogenase [Chromatiales bacterium]|nr:alanine dehydrogenase [Gammaproteobacteria bacterium]MCP5352852.1 alanine dehydrogenase [Chromatiales bacterium]
MRIGIPKEIKTLEGRVGLVPAVCAELVRAGHEVFIEHDAGRRAGFPDADYRNLGVHVAGDADELYAAAQLVVKVKEPQPSELALLNERHLLFAYLHLAGDATLARGLAATGCTAIAFETVRDANDRLPMLAPMSEIAGRLAVLHGGSFLLAPNGGRGVLLGGAGADEHGRVTVIGGGVAGGSAVRTVAALGADVTVFDTQATKLAEFQSLGGNVRAFDPRVADVAATVADSDLVIGAVLIPGARAPHVISAEMVRAMRPGSVVVDVSIDQGGCVETIRPTTYAEPTFVWEEVIHYGVTNMPGAVPHTASLALSAAIAPYVRRLADGNWNTEDDLGQGTNVRDGRVVHPQVLASLAGQDE